MPSGRSAAASQSLAASGGSFRVDIRRSVSSSVYLSNQFPDCSDLAVHRPSGIPSF